MTASDTGRTWPFWAPSRAESVEAALDLAGVGPGTRFVDLGCGDGQVVAAAARRGAQASGIEADADLVEEARSNLADAGLAAEVSTGDLFDPACVLDADVFFTYLAPATLQRLLPRLRSRRGAALVTVDFAVPGVVVDASSGSAHLYRLPGRRRRVREPGWPSAGTLVATVADLQSLTCLELVHPGGPVTTRLSRPLAAVATTFAGADHLDRAAALAVDLRWDEVAAGTVVAGQLRVSGADDHALFVVFGDEEEAVWELDERGVAAALRAMRRRRRPTSAAELLAAIDT